MQFSQPSKKDLETTVDVLKEIFSANADSEQQKEHNERCALICKLLINGFGGDMSSENRNKRSKQLQSYNQKMKR